MFAFNMDDANKWVRNHVDSFVYYTIALWTFYCRSNYCDCDALFVGLHSAVARNPELRGYVQDMLINHFSQFYQSDSDTVPPLIFTNAVRLKDNCAELQVCYVRSLLLFGYKIQCDQV
jgi:hypothetical protein